VINMYKYDILIYHFMQPLMYPTSAARDILGSLRPTHDQENWHKPHTHVVKSLGVKKRRLDV